MYTYIFRAGAHCEKCKDNYYPSPHKDKLGRQPCSPCNCHQDGSLSEQCSDSGQCTCREGVTGDTCDTCQDQHWNFPTCRPCQCYPPGTRDNVGTCVEQSGTCQCKDYVEGDSCDACMEGHFQVLQRFLNWLHFIFTHDILD